MTAERVPEVAGSQPVPGLWVYPGTEPGSVVLHTAAGPHHLSEDDLLNLSDALFAAREGRTYVVDREHVIEWNDAIRKFVVEVAAARYKIDPATVYAGRRGPGTRARDVAMFLLRELTDASLPQIGKAFGRHHTSVLAAVSRVQVRERYDHATRVMLNDLRRRITE